jgi:transcriptional regulator with XRE-family HTH domain
VPSPNDLGRGLREARLAQRLTLRSVAAATGISPSLLSQVESGKTQPSVSTLYALVSHLGISIDGLLGTAPATPGGAPRAADRSVQRREDNPRVEMMNGVSWERLAIGGSAAVDPLLVTYAPGAASSVDGRMMRHSGLEYGYIIRGDLTLKLDFDTHVLHPGDSLCFESQRPHLYLNDGGEPAQGLWFVLGRTGLSDPKAVAPPSSAVEVLELLGHVSPHAG